ncbi:hypothetical protein FLAG1_11567 [Fusarium langsethiae]|uniref:Uncharacterized protein n=1 Tax=Fusarium langsethiae TaxID=179993 RepID=A0A0N0DAR6_FUSLA|nr:hypothetical protein FLAG1_11567 [Fusarium langsethiae]
MSGDLGSRPADYDPSSCLEQSVTKEVLHNSYNIYNNLPAETSLPIDEQEHLVYLSQVIRDSKASNAIGVIALHQHETLLPNHSFVGNTEQLDDERYAYYIQKSANERINIDKVCGYKFAYVEGKGLCPFEFRQGQMPDLSGVDKTFVPRIVQYLVKNLQEQNDRVSDALGDGTSSDRIVVAEKPDDGNDRVALGSSNKNIWPGD